MYGRHDVKNSVGKDEAMLPDYQAHGRLADQGREYTYQRNASTIPRTTSLSCFGAPRQNSDSETLDFGGLTLADVEEEFASENYTISSGPSNERTLVSYPRATGCLKSLQDQDFKKTDYTSRNHRYDEEEVSFQSPYGTSTTCRSPAKSHAINASESKEVPILPALKNASNRKRELKIPENFPSKNPTALKDPISTKNEHDAVQTSAQSNGSTGLTEEVIPLSPDLLLDGPDTDVRAHSTLGIGSWALEDSAGVRAQKIEGFAATESQSESQTERRQQAVNSVQEHAGGFSEASPGSYSATSKGSNGSGSRNSRQDTSKSGGPRKKRISDTSEGSKGDGSSDGDGEGEREREGDSDTDKSKKQKRQKCAQRRFACPFNKNDPVYFKTNLSLADEEKYMTCAAGKGWENYTRLKEHLVKKHLLDYECSTCGMGFVENNQLEEHLRNQECHYMCPAPPAKGLTPSVQEKLRQRTPNSKHKRQVSEEERWFDIYHLLFPGVSDPSSPYREDSDHIPPPVQFNHPSINFLERELGPLISKRLKNMIEALNFGPDWREQLKASIDFEVGNCVMELSAGYQAISFDNHNLPTKVPSVDSRTDDSAYSSLPTTFAKCGNCEYNAWCDACLAKATPFKTPSQSSLPPESPSARNGSEDGCIDPALLTRRG